MSTVRNVSGAPLELASGHLIAPTGPGVPDVPGVDVSTGHNALLVTSGLLMVVGDLVPVPALAQTVLARARLDNPQDFDVLVWDAARGLFVNHRAPQDSRDIAAVKALDHYTGGADTTNDLLNAVDRAVTSRRVLDVGPLAAGWTWTQPIVSGTQRLVIRGHGPDTVFKQTVPGVELATNGGSRGAATLIVEDIQKNSQTFKVAPGAVPAWMVPGAVGVIRDKAQEWLGTGGAPSEGVGGENVHIATVNAVTGVITTLGRFDLQYNLVTEAGPPAYADNNLDIRPLTLLTGLGFHDFALWLPEAGTMGPGTFGIISPWTYRMHVSNVIGVGLDDDLIRVPGCVGGIFDNVGIDNCDKDVAYGLHFHHSSSDITVNHPWQRYSRHVVTSGGAPLEPVSAHVTINDLHAWEPQSAPASEHAEARDWVWDGVHVHSGGSNSPAVQLRGVRSVARNVTARGLKLVVHVVESADGATVEGVDASNVEDIVWVNGAQDVTVKNIEGRAVSHAGLIVGYPTAGQQANKKPTGLFVEKFRVLGDPSYAVAAFDLAAASGYLGYGDETMTVRGLRCPDATVPIAGGVEAGVVIDDRVSKLTVAPQIPHTEADGPIVAARVYVVRYVPRGLEPIDKIVFLLGLNAANDDAMFVGILDATGLILRASGSTLGHLNTGEDNPIGVDLTARQWLHPGNAYYRALYVPALTGAAPQVTFAGFQNAMAKAADDSLPDLESGYGTTISGGTFVAGATVSDFVNGGAPVLMAGTA